MHVVHNRRFVGQGDIAFYGVHAQWNVDFFHVIGLLNRETISPSFCLADTRS